MDRRLCHVFLALILLAGCTSPRPPGPPTAEDLAPPGFLVLSNAIVDPDAVGTEPMLGEDGAGNLYTYSRRDTPDGVRAGPLLIYQSGDGGNSWAPEFDPGVPSHDPDLVGDVDGTLWFDTYVLETQCNYVAVRAADGSWRANPAVCNGQSWDRPRIIPTHGGEAFLYHVSLSSGGVMGVLRTTDHGLTWLPLPPMRLPDNRTDGWGGGGFWNPVTDTVTFTFLQRAQRNVLENYVQGPTTSYPAIASTRDDGLTWTVTRVPGVAWTDGNGAQVGAGGLVDGTADAAGAAYIAWAEMVDGTSAVHMASSTDDGRTWTTPVRVHAAGRSQVFPTIAAAGAGQVAIAYYEANEAGRPDEVSDQADWNVAVSWTSDGTAPSPTFQHGRLSSAPNHAGPLCIEASLGSSTACEGGRRPLDDFFDLDVLRDGRLAASWSSTLAEADATVTLVGVAQAPWADGSGAVSRP